LPSLQDIKSVAERLTGIARPKVVLPRPRKAHARLFKGDGETPNNPKFPLILYRSPVSLADATDPAAVLEVLFAANGWKPAWRNGIYPYSHFHTGTHEVVGIARGHARVRYGGKKGRTIEVRAGDVAIHPAGVGHCRLSASKDLLVVGAYPKQCRYDEPKPEDIDYNQAVKSISAVGLPDCDPVYGADGPLITIWRAPH
jgi:uncharacterized protein YjlB